MVKLGKRLAVDVLQQSHMNRLSCELQGQQVLAIIGGDHPRHFYRAVLGQVLEGGMLGLEFLDGIVTMANLQHKPSALAVDAIVEVLLAAQGSQVTAESVIRAQQHQRLFGTDLWAWQTGTVNQRSEWHTTTPEVVLSDVYLAIESGDKQPLCRR
ncbi:hypothetical protein GKKCFE_00040 [Pseudomonas sp. E141]